jgi:AcrR family transcriptional regulator
VPRKPKPTTTPDTSIWTRPQQGSRGPSKAHDHASIAEAAVRIADAEGLEAVSMRRLAAELGAGAASLYRYVANKDELFELMVDSVMAQRSPPRPTGHWRDDMRTLANKLRALFLRHPWLGVLSAFRPARSRARLRR